MVKECSDELRFERSFNFCFIYGTLFGIMNYNRCILMTIVIFRKRGIGTLNEIETALELFQGAWPTIQPAISTVFGAIVANLFLKSNTKKTEIEKLKQTKFSEVADKLLEGGHITHLEYYKCRNFNKIAKKADEVYQKQDMTTLNNDKKFSWDWFVRFFEDAGNISDEKMQEIWAKVLAGEIKQPGSFSLRTLEVLRNLSSDEAEIGCVKLFL